MFELRNVSKSYSGRQVLAPLDLTIPTGRTLVLIGPSGCGKSTLLRLLLGLLQPDSGTVLFGEQEMSGPQVLELRHKVGVRHPGGRTVSPPDRTWQCDAAGRLPEQARR